MDLETGEEPDPMNGMRTGFIIVSPLCLGCNYLEGPCLCVGDMTVVGSPTHCVLYFFPSVSPDRIDFHCRQVIIGICIMILLKRAMLPPETCGF